MRWRSASESCGMANAFGGRVLLLCHNLREQLPGLERAGNGPGLCRRAARMVRRLAVEDFANRAHTLIFQRVARTLQDGKRRPRIASHPIDRETERSKQPAPDRPLVITAVALEHASAIMGMVRRVVRCQRAQSKCGKEVMPADPYDLGLIVNGERTVR